MAVTVKEEVVEPTRLRLVPTDEPPPHPVPANPPGRNDQALAVMVALGHIIGPRLILLLAGMGAFIISVIAAHGPSLTSMVAAGSYDVFVLGPILFLAIRKPH